MIPEKIKADRVFVLIYVHKGDVQRNPTLRGHVLPQAVQSGCRQTFNQLNSFKYFFTFCLEATSSQLLQIRAEDERPLQDRRLGGFLKDFKKQ